jgi:cleavage and polyadenylation specificity factor subunit 6/7
MAPRPRAFDAMIGDGGGFPSVGQCGPMPPMVAPHVNPAYLAASRMAMGGGNGTGPWHNQGMAGGFWGGPQPWNFGGCEMPWQQPGMQQQQQYRNGDYGKMRSTGRERPGGRNEDRDIGNVRGNPDRRQCGRGGGERPRERDRHQEQRKRNYDDRDRRGGIKRRYQEYTERDDWQRRGRARSSQSRNSDDDDNPRRQSRDSDDDDYVIQRR